MKLVKPIEVDYFLYERKLARSLSNCCCYSMQGGREIKSFLFSATHHHLRWGVFIKWIRNNSLRFDLSWLVASQATQVFRCIAFHFVVVVVVVFILRKQQHRLGLMDYVCFSWQVFGSNGKERERGEMYEKKD